MDTAAFLALAVVVGAPQAKDPPKKEAPALVGEWVIEKVITGGLAVPLGPGLNESSVTFGADGTVTTRKGGKKEVSGTYKTDPKKDPPEIDFTEPPSLGVYRLDGDTLVLCLSEGSAAERPKKLQSPAGSTAILITLKRVKKD